MAKKVVQTAAVHVVHLERPTEKEEHEAVQQFKLHPLDQEGFFTVLDRPSIEPSGEALMLKMRWPFIHPLTKEVVGADVCLVVGDRSLLIVEDGNTPAWGSWIDQLSAESTDSPAMLAYEVLMSAWRAAREHYAQHAGNADMGTSRWPSAFGVLADAISDFHRALTERKLIANHDVDIAYRLLIHSLRHADRACPPSPSVTRHQTVPHWMRVATGYAVISGAALIAILLIRT